MRALLLLCLGVLSLAACAPLPAENPPLPTTISPFNTTTATASPFTPLATNTTLALASATVTTVTPTPSATPTNPSPTSPSPTSPSPTGPSPTGPTPAAARSTNNAPPTASAVSPTTQPLTVHLTIANNNLLPGEPVSLTWTSNGGATSEVHLQLFSDGGGSQTIQTWSALPTNGSLQATIPGAQARDRYFFMLVIAENGVWADSLVPVFLPCPDDFFFDRALLVNSTVCPANPPSYPTASEQVFEGGRMLWLQSENRIYVLYNNVNLPHALEIFENPWQAGEPEDDPTLTPPPNLFQPLRGFGAIWRGETQPLRGWLNVVVREQLGWAVGPEVTFTSADQSEWVTGIVRQECLATRFPCSPFRYLRLSDGRIVKYTFNAKPADVPFWLYLTP